MLQAWKELDVPIQGTFHLFYPSTPENNHPVNLRYMVIFNEQQTAVFDDESDLYHDLTLQPGEEATLSLHLPPLHSGIYDLIVLGIVNEVVNNYGDVVWLPYRATLIAGENAPASKQTYHLLQPAAYKSPANGFYRFSLHSDQSQHVWVWPEVYKKAHDTLDFFISAGYVESSEELTQYGISPQPSPFAILAFLDSKQVTLTADTDPFYGIVTPDNLYSYIPISLRTSNYHGKRDLLVLRVNYPRILMCWLKGDREGYQFDSNVYTMRVGVEFD